MLNQRRNLVGEKVGDFVDYKRKDSDSFPGACVVRIVVDFSSSS